MIANTKGFVLRTIPYSESSVIAKIFTQHDGLQSFIIKGVRSSKGRNKQNMLQPLSYIDFTFYQNSKAEIKYIKEIKPAKQWSSIPYDYTKTSILFFMTELLYKTVREEEENHTMFRHILNSVSTLDELNEALANFPIAFMLSTAKHLGIVPLNNYDSQHTIFSMHEGRFVNDNPLVYTKQQTLLNKDTSLVLHQYLSTVSPTPTPPFALRMSVLTALLDYYKIHFNDLRDFQSHLILHEVLQS